MKSIIPKPNSASGHIMQYFISIFIIKKGKMRGIYEFVSFNLPQLNTTIQSTLSLSLTIQSLILHVKKCLTI